MKKSLFALPLIVLAVSGPVDVWAQQGHGQGQGRGGPEMGPPPEGRAHDRRDDHRALSDAVRRVERQTGGQVLSAERVPFDGRDVNRVKVVDSSGRVRIYMDDPQSRDTPRTRRDDNDND